MAIMAQDYSNNRKILLRVPSAQGDQYSLFRSIIVLKAWSARISDLRSGADGYCLSAGSRPKYIGAEWLLLRKEVLEEIVRIRKAQK
jgi:hypothetical protein